MAKLDLASSEWCQLIFEGKNQAYGAYRICHYSKNLVVETGRVPCDETGHVPSLQLDKIKQQ